MYDRLSTPGRGDLDAIHAGAIEILSRTGMWFESTEARDLFKKHGFKVDGDRVYFESAQIEAALKQPPSGFDVIAPDPAKRIYVGGYSMVYSSSCSSTRILDLDGNVRRANSKDYEDSLKLFENMEAVDFLFEYVTSEDLPSETYLLWNLFAQMQVMSKPLSCQTVDGIGLLAEFYDTSPDKMRESAGNGLAYGITFINPISPLGMSAHESNKLMRFCEAGVSLALSPMSMAGMTAPCTVEGLLIQQNAEILGALVLSQLTVPGAPVLYGCLGSTTNMRNMMTPVGAAESRIIEHSAAQMARYYNIPSRCIVGMTDSNELDYQAGAESILNYVQAARSGVNAMTGLGCYANWMIASYEKLLLDAESVAYVKRLLRPLDFSGERAAIDVIEAVGPRGNYITEDHTIENFREEFYEASVFGRQPYANYVEGGREDCRKAANKKVREMLEGYQRKPLEKSLDRRLRAYCEKHGLGAYIQGRFE